MIKIQNNQKTIILPVVLYGCETWPLISREEHRLMVTENRVLRRISGPERDKIIEDSGKLHNEELHNLYSLNIIRVIKSRRMRWEGNVAHGREEVATCFHAGYLFSLFSRP
jgi:hypothetical protein